MIREVCQWCKGRHNPGWTARSQRLWDTGVVICDGTRHRQREPWDDWRDTEPPAWCGFTMEHMIMGQASLLQSLPELMKDEGIEAGKPATMSQPEESWQIHETER